MAAATTDSRLCETPGCNSASKLQCPTCIKLGIQGSFFCSQECFKSSWKSHKVLHKLAKGEEKNDKNSYDPWPSYRFTGKLRPYPQMPRCTVPPNIPRPDYADHPQGVPVSEQSARSSAQIRVLTDEEIEGMRVACKARTQTKKGGMSPSRNRVKNVSFFFVCAPVDKYWTLGREVLDEAAKVIDIGVTTDEIDRVVHEACIDRECYPSPLNYYEFPRSCCTAVNEVICHGIPDTRPLKDGDICNVDVTVYHRGFHGDLNETFLLGTTKEDANKLVRVAWECLNRSIDIAFQSSVFVIPPHDERSLRWATLERNLYNGKSDKACMVRPGEKYREIGNVIQKHAQAHGFSVVRSYCGHGIHRLFHTAPSVPHYAKNKAVGVMKPGHCFTIEPMISQGSWRDEMWPDHWTAVTIDGMLSAQFEQTLLVTETGCDILTRRQANNGLPYFMDTAV